jgi:hypothetical protein
VNKMKKHTLISLGILTILAIFGLWGYLFLYGAPQAPKEVFSNLGFFGTPAERSERTVDTLTPQDATRLALGSGALEQITTKSVAGFGVATRTPNTILYAQQGTGHIFEIDLATGLERQVTLTTIPEVSAAVFSQSARAVALTVYEGYIPKTSIGTLTESSDQLRLSDLRDGARDVVFVDDNTVRYVVSNSKETVGYERKLVSLDEKVLFKVPVGDSVMSWAGTIGIAPRPSQTQGGALYSIEGGILNPETPFLSGLSGFFHGTMSVYSYTDGERYLSAATNGIETIEQGIILLAEKCADEEQAGIMWCAAPLLAERSYLTDWYKGLITSEDYLWQVDLDAGSAVLYADFSELSSRTLDVEQLTAAPQAPFLLFRNKLDGTLWIFRTQNTETN